MNRTETDRLSEGAAREVAKLSKDGLAGTLASAAHDLIQQAHAGKPDDAWMPLFQAHAIVKALAILHAVHDDEALTCLAALIEQAREDSDQWRRDVRDDDEERHAIRHTEDIKKAGAWLDDLNQKLR